jgi:hypothetical protein
MHPDQTPSFDASPPAAITPAAVPPLTALDILGACGRRAAKPQKVQIKALGESLWLKPLLLGGQEKSSDNATQSQIVRQRIAKSLCDEYGVLQIDLSKPDHVALLNDLPEGVVVEIVEAINRICGLGEQGEAEVKKA